MVRFNCVIKMRLVAFRRSLPGTYILFPAFSFKEKHPRLRAFARCVKAGQKRSRLWIVVIVREVTIFPRNCWSV